MPTRTLFAKVLATFGVVGVRTFGLPTSAPFSLKMSVVVTAMRKLMPLFWNTSMNDWKFLARFSWRGAIEPELSTTQSTSMLEADSWLYASTRTLGGRTFMIFVRSQEQPNTSRAIEIRL
jgi:hypothetical protein